jgi:hypothetical protein
MQWRKGSLTTKDAEQLDVTYKKMNLDMDLAPFMKMNPKCIQDLHVKCKTRARGMAQVAEHLPRSTGPEFNPSPPDKQTPKIISIDKYETMQLLEDNRKSSDLGLGLFRYSSKSMKEIIDKFNFFKVNFFCSAKDAAERMKWQATDWGTYLQNTYLIKEKLLKVNNKKTHKQLSSSFIADVNAK